MAPPGAHRPPGGADGSPPRAEVSCQSAVARPGTLARGARAAPSDLECRPDPRQGRPGCPVAPHHPTLAPSLYVASLAQTPRPLSACPAPHVPGEAGSPPPHRGQTGAGTGTPGLG